MDSQMGPGANQSTTDGSTSTPNSLQVEEYKATRADLLKRQDRKLHITIAYASVCAAVWALVLKASGDQSESIPNILPLLPLVAVSLGTMLVYVEDHTINQLSMYLLLFYEEQNYELYWERFLQRKRSRGKKTFDSKIRFFVARAAIPYGCIFTSIALWGYKTEQLGEATVFEYVLMSLTVPISIISVWYASRSYSGRIRDNLMKHERETRDKLQGNMRDDPIGQ